MTTKQQQQQQQQKTFEKARFLKICYRTSDPRQRIAMLNRADLIVYVCGSSHEIERLDKPMQLGVSSFHNDYNRLHYIQRFANKCINITFCNNNSNINDSVHNIGCISRTLRRDIVRRDVRRESAATAAASTQDENIELNSIVVERASDSALSQPPSSSSSPSSAAPSQATHHTTPHHHGMAIATSLLALPERSSELVQLIIGSNYDAILALKNSSSNSLNSNNNNMSASLFNLKKKLHKRPSFKGSRGGGMLSLVFCNSIVERRLVRALNKEIVKFLAKNHASGLMQLEDANAEEAANKVRPGQLKPEDFFIASTSASTSTSTSTSTSDVANGMDGNLEPQATTSSRDTTASEQTVATSEISDSNSLTTESSG